MTAASLGWERLLTRPELAELLRVSVPTVDRMRRDGMPCVTWGRRLVRFRAAEGDMPDLVVDLYLEQPVRFADVLVCGRVTSLSPEWLARLWQQFLRLRLGRDYMDFLKQLVEAADAA